MLQYFLVLASSSHFLLEVYELLLLFHHLDIFSISLVRLFAFLAFHFSFYILYNILPIVDTFFVILYIFLFRMRMSWL